MHRESLAENEFIMGTSQSPHHFRSEHIYLHLYKSSTFTLRKICSLFSHLGVSISDWSFCCCVGTLCTSGLWRETCLQKTMGCFPPPLDTAEGLLPLSRQYIHPCYRHSVQQGDYFPLHASTYTPDTDILYSRRTTSRVLPVHTPLIRTLCTAGGLRR